jgi:hypothetical protein
MSNLTDQLFGPLSKQFCAYFYYLSIINYFVFVFLLLSMLYIGIFKRKDGAFYLQMVMTALLYGIMYFQNRLLHSMCVNSL